MFKLVALVLVLGLVPQIVRAQDGCTAPEPVRSVRHSVFIISAFNPFASAVRVSKTRLVTARHVVADGLDVDVILKDGSKIKGRVVPSAYDGDLVLIDVPALVDGPVPDIADTISADSTLYSVGADDGRRKVRVYPPGKVVLQPGPDTQHGRLHHTAYSQYGNSGGALVDARGRLVAIIASGGEGRFEAIPAADLKRLTDLSGPEFAKQSSAIGRAVRECTVTLETPMPRRISDEQAEDIAEVCSRTANRQLYDMAASALGQRLKATQAIRLSQASVARDPNSLNARLILLTNLHIARLYDEELPHIRFLLKHMPEEPMVHRFAVQAGKWAEDMELAKKGLELVKQHNPAQFKAAESFLQADIPRPKPLQ